MAQVPETQRAATVEVSAGGLSSYTLKNGFKIILIPFPSASNTRVELLVKSGSKMEGYGETGVAHLLEHMLFKGVGSRKNVKDDLTAMGANWNGTTTADRTNYFETISSDPQKIDEVIRLEADRFLRARFTKADLVSEMTVVRNELENSERSPARLVMDGLARHGFIWHGYARSTIGARTDIENTSYATLRAFHTKHYRADNAALIVSGNFDAQRVLRLANELFSVATNPSPSKPNNWTFDSPLATTNRSEIWVAAGTTIAASAWKLPGGTERDAHALDLAITAVCDSDWGSLRKELVTKQGLAVSAACYTSADADYSRLLAFANAGQDADAEMLSKQLIQHIQTSAMQGITSEQLERARLSELNQTERAFESHESIARLASQYEVLGDWRLMFWVRDVVQSIGLEEANTALKKWVISTNRADVLLRHADNPSALNVPAPANAALRVEGKMWTSIVSAADPAPSSLSQLAKATRTFTLETQRAQASLISRKTQGDKVWLVMANDYGTPETLKYKRAACSAVSSLMNFGGGGLTRDALSKRMEELKASWNLSLSGITLEVPRKNLDQAFEILLSAWISPLLPIHEFESYKAEWMASYEAQLKNPVAVADNASRLRFDNFPDGSWSKPQTYQARMAELQGLSYEEAKQCAQEFVNISHIRLGVVGDLQEEHVRALWAKTANFKTAGIPYQRVPEPTAPKWVDTTPIRVEMPDTSNAKVTGSLVVALSRQAKEFAALQLAVEVVGGNASSLLWKALREKEGLAYSTGMQMSSSMLDQRTTIMVYATSASSQADKTLDQLKQVLERTLDQGLSATDIAQAKKTWAERRKAFLGKESNFAATLSDALYDGYDFAARAQLDAAIAKVTAQDATAAFRQFLRDASIVWTVGQGK